MNSILLSGKSSDCRRRVKVCHPEQDLTLDSPPSKISEELNHASQISTIPILAFLA
jgi:hypothetical protein